MDKNTIIHQVKSIILKHTKPLAIYLYGSVATNEATSSSDIDIAYEDPNFKDHYLIEEEISKLQTLVKIDVKNIAFMEDRFKNRVKSSGILLYSANKKLRAQDGLYNFKRALDRFISAIEIEEELKKEGFGDIYLDLIAKRFEFTYEMAWKALKRYLDYLGLDAKNPRSVFKEAFSQGIITDEAIWLDMIEVRNTLTHIYDEYQVREAFRKLLFYKEAFLKLQERLSLELKEQE